MADGKPPFRAEHVGSLPRPEKLMAARKQFAEGKLGREQLGRIEDESIRGIVAMQERVGIGALTDGEFPKSSWRDFLFESCEGFGEQMPSSMTFRQFDGKPFPGGAGRRVTGRIRRKKPLSAADFSRLKEMTKKPIKANLPTPSTAHFATGDAALDRAVYRERAPYFADLVKVYREEIADLGDRGCTYLQMDEVPLAVICDPRNRDIVKSRGEDPEQLIDQYVALINDSIRGRPKNMTVCVHMCRGNIGHGMASGGYEHVAERMFGTLEVDGYFLEFDTPRAGDFTPLRFLPKDKKVVLGLITTKLPELEPVDALKRRIDEASLVVDRERLALSPQCGFASAIGPQRLTDAEVEAKLARVVEVARQVWG
jgi:5-methyltetrahydropteroyltriglutamate--homocysteine methyltransferase